MSGHSINDPKHWLDRAKDTRALAEQIGKVAVRSGMWRSGDFFCAQTPYSEILQKPWTACANKWGVAYSAAPTLTVPAMAKKADKQQASALDEVRRQVRQASAPR